MNELVTRWILVLSAFTAPRIGDPPSRRALVKFDRPAGTLEIDRTFRDKGEWPGRHVRA